MKTLIQKHYLIVVTTALFALASAATALAQPPAGKGRGMGPGGGPHLHMGPGGPGDGGRHHMKHEVMKHLYPVHLVRRHADELKLSDNQYQKLRSVVTRVKDEIEQLKWDLEREAQKLVQLVAKGAKREQIYAQMDSVFQYENQIKKKRLGLMISVRDILTNKQRKRLDKIKEEFGKQEGRSWRGRGKGKRRQGHRLHKPFRSRG